MMNDLPSIALPRQFVVLNEMPVMSTGKIDFRTVTRMVQDTLKNNP